MYQELLDGGGSPLYHPEVQYLLWCEQLHWVGSDCCQVSTGHGSWRNMQLELRHMDHWVDLGVWWEIQPVSNISNSLEHSERTEESESQFLVATVCYRCLHVGLQLKIYPITY